MSSNCRLPKIREHFALVKLVTGIVLISRKHAAVAMPVQIVGRLAGYVIVFDTRPGHKK